MREILFRGKRNDNGEWVEGYLFRDPDLETAEIAGWEYWHSETGAERGMYCFPVDPSTVGQYTGLIDKNGKRIFEGDVISGYTLYGKADFRNAVVRWDKMFSAWHAGESRSLFYGLGDIYEIICNIHDNPELLEGGGAE